MGHVALLRSVFQSEDRLALMGSSAFTDIPGIYTDRDRNQYLKQYEYACHEDRLSVGEIPLLTSKTIGNHEN